GGTNPDPWNNCEKALLCKLLQQPFASSYGTWYNFEDMSKALIHASYTVDVSCVADQFCKNSGCKNASLTDHDWAQCYNDGGCQPPTANDWDADGNWNPNDSD